MKQVLVLSRRNSVRGPMAKAYILKCSKCAVMVQCQGIYEQPEHRLVAEVLKEDGIAREEEKAAPDISTIEFDYVITVCDEAKRHLPALKGKPLYFHYHFEDLLQKKTEGDAIKAELKELRNTVRQYFERFCKMYLNEFS
jgi:arsenate reductase